MPESVLGGGVGREGVEDGIDGEDCEGQIASAGTSIDERERHDSQVDVVHCAAFRSAGDIPERTRPSQRSDLRQQLQPGVLHGEEVVEAVGLWVTSRVEALRARTAKRSG